MDASRLGTAAVAVVVAGVIGITLLPATTPSGAGALASAIPSPDPGASLSQSRGPAAGPVLGRSGDRASGAGSSLWNLLRGLAPVAMPGDQHPVRP